MAVVGVGIDIVEVERMRLAVTDPRTGARFRRRIFRDEEQRRCEGAPRPAERYAARFAAKEAVLKALAAADAVRPAPAGYHDIEIWHTAGGAPQVRLHGRMAERARRLGVERLHVSLSHERSTAVAQVVAEGCPKP